MGALLHSFSDVSLTNAAVQRLLLKRQWNCGTLCSACHSPPCELSADAFVSTCHTKACCPHQQRPPPAQRLTGALGSSDAALQEPRCQRQRNTAKHRRCLPPPDTRHAYIELSLSASQPLIKKSEPKMVLTVITAQMLDYNDMDRIQSNTQWKDHIHSSTLFFLPSTLL